MSTSLFLFS